MLGFVAMYVPINKAVQKKSYISFNTKSQIILKEIRKDLRFPSTNILGFLLQTNIMHLRPCSSLSPPKLLFNKCFHMASDPTEFVLWHDRLT